MDTPSADIAKLRLTAEDLSLLARAEPWTASPYDDRRRSGPLATALDGAKEIARIRRRIDRLDRLGLVYRILIKGSSTLFPDFRRSCPSAQRTLKGEHLVKALGLPEPEETFRSDPDGISKIEQELPHQIVPISRAELVYYRSIRTLWDRAEDLQDTVLRHQYGTEFWTTAPMLRPWFLLPTRRLERQTPWQAARTAEGYRRVEALLVKFENDSLSFRFEWGHDWRLPAADDLLFPDG